jgi:hypothetical protein
MVGISINSKISGFRKWAEAHPPIRIDEAGTGTMEERVAAATNVAEGGKALDQQPHRPWLVPGLGRL